MCKKLERKKITKSKFNNVPEYEVYRDFLELRKHQNKEHFVCNEFSELCRQLVFESNAQLASHYMNVHGKQMPVRVDFGDDHEEEEEQEEEKKEANIALNKETYKDHFPTLSAVSKA